MDCRVDYNGLFHIIIYTNAAVGRATLNATATNFNKNTYLPFGNNPKGFTISSLKSSRSYEGDRPTYWRKRWRPFPEVNQGRVGILTKSKMDERYPKYPKGDQTGRPAAVSVGWNLLGDWRMPPTELRCVRFFFEESVCCSPNNWGCTSSGVYVPCVYTQARWELQLATRVFVVVFVWRLSSAS